MYVNGVSVGRTPLLYQIREYRIGVISRIEQEPQRHDAVKKTLLYCMLKLVPTCIRQKSDLVARYILLKNHANCNETTKEFGTVRQ